MQMSFKDNTEIASVRNITLHSNRRPMSRLRANVTTEQRQQTNQGQKSANNTWNNLIPKWKQLEPAQTASRHQDYPNSSIIQPAAVLAYFQFPLPSTPTETWTEPRHRFTMCTTGWAPTLTAAWWTEAAAPHNSAKNKLFVTAVPNCPQQHRNPSLHAALTGRQLIWPT